MAANPSRKQWGRFCAGHECHNSDTNNRGMSFFAFPTDPERSKKWALFSRRQDLLQKTPQYRHNNCFLCPAHFEDSQFYNAKQKNRLLKWAVPTLFDVPNPPPKIAIKRPAPTKRQPLAEKKLKLDASQLNTSDHDLVPSVSGTGSGGNANYVKTSVSTLEATVEKMRKKNHCLRMKVCRLKKKRSQTSIVAKQCVKRAMRTSPRTIARRKLATLRVLLSEFLSGAALEFVMSQVAMAQRKPHGRRWTPQQKAFALSLLHASPKTYRLLCKVFALPSPKTLKKAVKAIKIYPGINDNIITALKLKTDSMSTQEKLVVLTFDEMSIREGLVYDQGRDLMEGVAETPERTNELANHALVFMVRGLARKWKQPIAYYLASGPMTGTAMKPLLLSCIDTLHSIGLKVVLCVCDQGSSNRNLLEVQLGVTANKPYFIHDKAKVFAMYDPPHLLKNIRNNLKAHGFNVGDDHVDVLWKHVELFYERDQAKPTQLAPKLTKNHIHVPAFKDLRVSLAAQVLSKTVSTGMAFMAQWKLIPEEAKNTADFLGYMDKLFNAFNSRSVCSKAEMSHAFSSDSGHKEFLEDSLTWIKTIKTKGKRRPGCLMGWELGIRCVLQLWDTLRVEYGMKFLLTSRLNQDCVENLFGVIRGKGAGYDNPDAQAFRAFFTQVMVDSILDKGDHSNCEEDLDKFLLTLESLPTVSTTKANNSAVFPELQPSPYESLVSTLPDSVRGILATCSFHTQMTSVTASQSTLNFKERNVNAYISGYIVRKLRGKVCGECYQKLLSDANSKDADDLSFIRMKRYQAAKDGLIFPSEALMKALSVAEMAYRYTVDRAVYGVSVKATLCHNISKRIKFTALGLHCDKCKVHTAIVHIMVNIRLHHSVKRANESLKKDNSRKNRKVLKFAHL